MKLSITEGGKDGKSRAIASCRCFGGEVSGMQEKRRSGSDNECWGAWSGLENKHQALGDEGEGEKKEVRCEILAHQEKSNLPEKFNEDWCDKAVGNGFGSRESVARTSRWHRAHRKAEVEEANGSSRKEGVSLSPFMDVNSVEVEEELSTMATLSWAEGVWLGRW